MVKSSVGACQLSAPANFHFRNFHVYHISASAQIPAPAEVAARANFHFHNFNLPHISASAQTPAPAAVPAPARFVGLRLCDSETFAPLSCECRKFARVGSYKESPNFLNLQRALTCHRHSRKQIPNCQVTHPSLYPLYVSLHALLISYNPCCWHEYL